MASNQSPSGGNASDALTNAVAKLKVNVEEVKDLLNQGVDPNVTDSNGRTAVQTMNWSYPEIAQLLLERGANPNVQDSATGRTPLHDAVHHGTHDTVLCLIQGGADANVRDNLGNTPAHLAAQYRQEQMVSVLQNFSPTSFQERNNDGKTPYDLAIERGHHEIAQQIAQFMEKSADG